MMTTHPMRPWWENLPDETEYPPIFRTCYPGATSVIETDSRDDGDPRLTPSGDIARRGTIPAYMPYAVLNPGRIRTTVQ